MQIWRQGYGDSVNWVCICVDEYAEEVAQDFQRMYFRKGGVINSFISARDDFPRFPAQLGCQGFVVLDATGRFVTLRSTPSFLDARGEAFKAVERLLEPLLVAHGQDLDQAKIPPGSAEAATAATAKFAANACRDELADIGGEMPELPATGHEGMDAEHASLVALCRAAAASMAASDLRALGREFAEHAAHEEALLEAKGFGGPAGGGASFSALASHAADHQRIINMAEVAAGRVDAEGLVPRAAVEGVCRAIVEHGVNYDVLYAEAVAESS